MKVRSESKKWEVKSKSRKWKFAPTHHCWWGGHWSLCQLWGQSHRPLQLLQGCQRCHCTPRYSMSFRTVCPSHLVVVGKTRIACDNVWDKSCIRFLSLTTTEAQPQTWQGWGEIASKLNFVTWDDPRPKCLYNMCLQQWHFSAVSQLCVYISSPRLNRGLKSHRNDLTKKSQVIIRYMPIVCGLDSEMIQMYALSVTAVVILRP